MMLRKLLPLLLCIVLPSVSKAKGVLLLTFDDENYYSWLQALPVFEKYHAHATFFPSGKIGDAQLEILQTLHNSGHAIGVHTVSHKSVPKAFERLLGDYRFFTNDVMPQLDAMKSKGINAISFAYPFGEHNECTDKYLLPKFRFLRGLEYRSYTKNNISLTSIDDVFVPVAKLSQTVYLKGIGVGEYYNTDIKDVLKALKRLDDRDEILTLVSHEISDEATGINMKTSWLEDLLVYSVLNHVDVISLDELNSRAPFEIENEQESRKSVFGILLFFCLGMCLLLFAIFRKLRSPIRRIH